MFPVHSWGFITRPSPRLPDCGFCPKPRGGAGFPGLPMEGLGPSPKPAESPPTSTKRPHRWTLKIDECITQFRVRPRCSSFLWSQFSVPDTNAWYLGRLSALRCPQPFQPHPSNREGVKASDILCASLLPSTHTHPSPSAVLFRCVCAV